MAQYSRHSFAPKGVLAMNEHSDIFNTSEFHNWSTPKNASWVESVLGGVRIEVPSNWKRQRMGERTLLVRTPDAGMTVGMVSGGGASCFFNVVKRVAGALSQTRVVNRSSLHGTSMEAFVIEGTGETHNSALEWFVAKLGDAHCGAVLYGIGSHSDYRAHLATLTTMLRSTQSICGDLTVRGSIVRSA
jgi:hypothetical protein